MYDIIIVGGGPAGLCAALYARRAEKTVLIIEKGGFGGQITYSPKVENYPGYESISGNELADKFVEQVLAQGADVELSKVLSVSEDSDGIKTVKTEDGEYRSKAVIIATGAKHRMLGIENEEKFVGEGISFCAVCDGAFYKDKDVAVIGGGNSALQEAILLSDVCKTVTVVQNLPFLTGEKKLAEQLLNKANVSVIYGATVNSILSGGNGIFKGIKLNTEDGEKELIVEGMFVAIGLLPQNEEFKNLIDTDSFGYADSDESCTTKTKGVFVAGDCRKKRIRQVSTATSDGAIAALAACDYVDSLK